MTELLAVGLAGGLLLMLVLSNQKVSTVVTPATSSDTNPDTDTTTPPTGAYGHDETPPAPSTEQQHHDDPPKPPPEHHDDKSTSPPIPTDDPQFEPAYERWLHSRSGKEWVKKFMDEGETGGKRLSDKLRQIFREKYYQLFKGQHVRTISARQVSDGIRDLKRNNASFQASEARKALGIGDTLAYRRNPMGGYSIPSFISSPGTKIGAERTKVENGWSAVYDLRPIEPLPDDIDGMHFRSTDTVYKLDTQIRAAEMPFTRVSTRSSGMAPPSIRIKKVSTRTPNAF